MKIEITEPGSQTFEKVPANSLNDDFPKFYYKQGSSNNEPSGESSFMPLGPALPPGKSMKFTTHYFLATKLRIVNENEKAATIRVNGTGQYIPPAEGSTPGILDLTAAWNFGKTYIITNQCSWALRIEY